MGPEKDTVNNYEAIALAQIPLIDVRAPVEFLQGSFPNAINLPIMEDEERRLVGICYKEKGNEEAVKLGHLLVSGEIRQQRIQIWLDFLKTHPHSHIFCFRGGKRSQIAQQWIREASGLLVPRLEGGYKAFRQYLLQQLEPQVQKATPILLGGCTGSGKTLIIRGLDHAIDLEGLANHRGSSFGRHITEQPSQIAFENRLAYALLSHRHKGHPYLVLEDEGQNVGRCFLPKPLVEHFKSGHMVVVEASLEVRTKLTLQEYVVESRQEHIQVYGQELGTQMWVQYIGQSLEKIKKRLGGELYKKLADLFEEALRLEAIDERVEEHESWIRLLLEGYYDPMYRYQLSRKTTPVLYTGTPEEVLAFLQNLEHKK